MFTFLLDLIFKKIKNTHTQPSVPFKINNKSKIDFIKSIIICLHIFLAKLVINYLISINKTLLKAWKILLIYWKIKIRFEY